MLIVWSKNIEYIRISLSLDKTQRTLRPRGWHSGDPETLSTIFKHVPGRLSLDCKECL